MFARSRVLLLALACLVTALALPAQADLTPPLTVQWVNSLGAEPDNALAPVLMGERVLVTHDGSMLSFDALTGEQQWEAKAEDQNITTAPVVWKDMVIGGFDNGILGAVRASDKSVVWTTNCGGRISPNPLLLDGTLFVGAGQTVSALDPDTGKTKWASTLSSPALYGPLSDGSTLFFRCQDGSLQTVAVETGRFRWRVPLPTGPESLQPVLAGGRVIVTSGDTLYALARTGAETWRVKLPAGIGGRVAVEEDTLFVPCVDGRIYTLSARSGRDLRGPNYQVEGSVTARPLVTESLLLVGTSGSLIYALDRATGDAKWVYRCRAPEQPVDEASVFGIYAPLVAGEGALYALTGGGDLYCFTATAPDAAGPSFAELAPPPGEGLGKDSLTISFAVYDDGCGIKADSVTLTVDGKPLDLKFDAAAGVATAWFPNPEDGIHLVKATATDNRGNSATKEWSFLTDETLTPEEPEDQTRSLSGSAGTGTGTTRGTRPAGGRTTGGR